MVITTSNRIPDDLYKHGLNRDLFVPFIDLIKDQMGDMNWSAQPITAKIAYQAVLSISAPSTQKAAPQWMMFGAT